MKNKKILYHFVLDKSGSMSNCRETTIIGFNTQLKTIKQLQKEYPDHASKEFTYHQIARIIKNLEQTEKWTFTFLGADIDAIHTSKM